MSGESLTYIEYNNAITNLEDKRAARGRRTTLGLSTAPAGAVLASLGNDSSSKLLGDNLVYRTSPFVGISYVNGSTVYRNHLNKMNQIAFDWEHKAGCSSCINICTTTCTGGCGGCGNSSCGTECTGQCWTACTGCTGCSGCSGCSGNCYGTCCNVGAWCSGCYSGCLNNCAGCSGCGGCSGNCGTGCNSRCGANCANCNGCSGNCYSGCNTICTTNCNAAGTSTSNCASCSSNCNNSCSTSSREGVLA